MKANITLTGVVGHGKALGRTVGMPTANLCPDAQSNLPEAGVYATYTEVDGKKWLSVTNIGVRPTVDARPDWTVESHIIGYSGDLYGKRITITLLERIRLQMRFETLEMVKKQVESDCIRAQEIREKYENG